VPVDVDDSQALWTLSAAEHAAVAAKSISNRLSFALLLKYFGISGCFPKSLGDLNRGVIVTLAKQIDSEVTIRNEAFELDRTVKRYRAEIRAFFGFRGATVRDAQELTDWLRDNAVVEGRDREMNSFVPPATTATMKTPRVAR